MRWRTTLFRSSNTSLHASHRVLSVRIEGAQSTNTDFFSLEMSMALRAMFSRAGGQRPSSAHLPGGIGTNKW